MAPVLIHYDQKLSREANSKPASRLPPHNDEDMKNMFTAVLHSRPDPTTIAEGDQYVWMDAGKPGLAHCFESVFKAGRTPMQKHKRTITILYSYASIMARRDRAKESKDVNLIETAHMISKNELKLPVKERVGLTGLNSTNGVGPLPINSPTSAALSVPWKVKKEILGDRIRRVGGPTEDAEPVDRRTPDDMEVVFLHSMSNAWYADLVSSGCYAAAIDLTPGDGGLAYACILKGVPVVCVAFNDTHAKHLESHIVARIFNDMTVPSSPAWLFEPALVELVSKTPSLPGSHTNPAPAGRSGTPPATGQQNGTHGGGAPLPVAGSSAAGGALPAPPAPGGQASTLEKLKQMLSQRQATGAAGGAPGAA